MLQTSGGGKSAFPELFIAQVAEHCYSFKCFLNLGSSQRDRVEGRVRGIDLLCLAGATKNKVRDHGQVGRDGALVIC